METRDTVLAINLLHQSYFNTEVDYQSTSINGEEEYNEEKYIEFSNYGDFCPRLGGLLATLRA